MARKQDPLTVEFLLLGLIQIEPIHAYDLDKKLNQEADLNIVWRFNQSQLYAILDKLEKNGLIQPQITPGAAFPFRKVYTITTRGAALFDDWKNRPVEKSHLMRSDFLAKLYFLRMEPLHIFTAAMEEQITCCQQWLTSFQKKRDETGEENEYQMLVFDFRIKTLEAILIWLENCSVMHKNHFCE